MEAKQFYRSEIIRAIRVWLQDLTDSELENTDAVVEGALDQANDGITGNMTGSYYCSSYNAQKAVDECHLLWCDEFRIFVEQDMGVSLCAIIGMGPEVVDVWARCWAQGCLVFEDDVLELIESERKSRRRQRRH